MARPRTLHTLALSFLCFLIIRSKRLIHAPPFSSGSQILMTGMGGFLPGDGLLSLDTVVAVSRLGSPD